MKILTWNKHTAGKEERDNEALDEKSQVVQIASQASLLVGIIFPRD
ncbi:MAG: hypothetical protein ACMUIA_04100 [bacterium]